MHVRRTKIVATIGPASSSPETIGALIEAGMDGARLNMSHGNHDDHRRRAALVREAEQAAGRPIALIADLQGPKLRVGDLEHPVTLSRGSEVVIAGEGPLRAELSRGTAELRGALAPSEAAGLIESASVLVAPSVIAADGSRDGIPMVLKEALALGVPVVASDAVGNPEVVEEAWGALYPAGDGRALSEALRALILQAYAEYEERAALSR